MSKKTQKNVMDLALSLGWLLQAWQFYSAATANCQREQREMLLLLQAITFTNLIAAYRMLLTKPRFANLNEDGAFFARTLTVILALDSLTLSLISPFSKSKVNACVLAVGGAVALVGVQFLPTFFSKKPAIAHTVNANDDTDTKLALQPSTTK